MATVITDPQEIKSFAHAVVRRALILYAETKIVANRAYTPKNMLDYVERETGKKFKIGQYHEAAAALDLKIKEINRGQ